MSTTVVNEQNELQRQNSSATNSSTQIEQSRVMQEVQAEILLAKMFPRSETLAHRKILDACSRKKFAETAMYSYPRGKDDKGRVNIVQGPSIKLAEEIIRHWGNVNSGFTELKRDNINKESEVIAYAWDKESNTRKTRSFIVSHYRHTKRGKYLLDDQRDIYEAIANYARRRERACCLNLIPAYIVEEAVEAVRNTLESDDAMSLQEKRKYIVDLLELVKVSAEQVEKYLGHGIDKITSSEVIELKGIYLAIKDKQYTVDDFFGEKVDATAAQEKAQKLTETLKNKKKDDQKEEKPEGQQTLKVENEENKQDLNAIVGEKELDELKKKLGEEKYKELLKESGNNISFNAYYDLMAT